MASLAIRLLGGFEIQRPPGETLPLSGRKAQALLAYLALAPGEPRTRERLIALLWSNRGEEQGRTSLRQALSELRRALRGLEPSPLIVDGQTITLDPDAVTVDAVTFARLIADGRPEKLAEAVDLYGGELLEGLGVQDPAFADWLRDERERLHDAARDAVLRLLDHRAARGDAAEIMVTARRLLALDPLQEAAHRALMTCHAAAGERVLALRQYRTCRDVLRAELGVEPEAETRRLYDEIRRSDPASRPEADPPRERSSGETLALPDRPSIAVLPFVNMSGDAEQEYFSDGVTEDIITELSRSRALFVIARNSSFHYKGRSLKAPDLGRELGVAYIVEGSVRKAANRVRVTAQLVETASGNHLWAERYDRDLDDIFAVQDEVVRTIVATLSERLQHVIAERADRKPPAELKAYEYFLRGRRHFYDWNSEDNRKAREFFEAALARDPTYCVAQVFLAFTYYADWIGGWTGTPREALDRFFALAEGALALDDTEAMAQDAAAFAHLYQGRHDEATFHIEKALALNPNDADLVMSRGYIAMFGGDHELAIARIKQAARLNPFGRFGLALGMALFCAGRYDDAIAALKTVRARLPHLYVFLAASHAHAGAPEAARAAVAQLLASARSEIAATGAPTPENWLAFFAERFPFRRAEDLDHLLGGLRAAGLPG